jgi:hypothetical protein
VAAAVAAEAPASSQWSVMAGTIEANMLARAKGFAAKEYPYGSEFAFDTTGQEEVVVWLTYFANSSNGFLGAAKRTVDFTLSHMRSSPTWAYHGGSRSWGDLGNNGKWMPSVGTRSNFETRGNFHYRSGLNAIPLFEWYRANPDDLLLLEVALGANAGQLTNIDEAGAPGMMLHMLPHILDFDPHSGDYGLGFFGHTLQAGAYVVAKPSGYLQGGAGRSSALAGSVAGTADAAGAAGAAGASTVSELLCYLCDLEPADADPSDSNTHADVAALGSGAVTITPRDSYRIRLYVEPVGVYIQADAGRFASFTLDLAKKTLIVHFRQEDAAKTSMWRLRVDKPAVSRPGANFTVQGAQPLAGGGIFELPTEMLNATIVWV